MKNLKENPNSEFRAISWKDGIKSRGYMLSQEITSDRRTDGTAVLAHIYSIDDTSFKQDEHTPVTLRYSIKLINNKGDVYEWYHIVNGINVTLMSNHIDMIQV